MIRKAGNQPEMVRIPPGRGKRRKNRFSGPSLVRVSQVIEPGKGKHRKEDVSE